MKLNFKFLKNLNVGAISTFVLFVIVIFELYFVYSQIYNNLNPEPMVNVTNRIVQVNLNSYSDTVNYINGLEIFKPQEIIMTNPNPFRYNRIIPK